MKLNAIPYFEVSFNNTKDEITFTFNYNNYKGRNGTSSITYNIFTYIWSSKFDTIDFTTFYNNYNYLIKKNKSSIDIINDKIIFKLESKCIDDILEPSLNPLYNIEYNELIIDPHFMFNIDTNQINNVYHEKYFLFMNNIHMLEGYNKKTIIKKNQNIPCHLLDKIINFSNINNFSYKTFIAEYA
jgi:hypothetical protein